ncbi:negative elongation factor A-like isoform X2 [Paramacrobiotus metropolitanus]|nr:negative elongation factor A-like isoform X2 [Paramacrobiotus metropolitanus]
MVNSPMFNGMRSDMMKHLKRLSERTRELQFVPYEAEFMNKKALTATYGNAPAPVKHFTLKQKPKSATLRADALLRANESKPKNPDNPSVPMRYKDQIKGIDQMLSGPSHSSAAVKRAYATGPHARVQAAKEKSLAAAKARPSIKVLDINEQPLTQDQGAHKRRRKLIGVPVSGSAAPGGDGKVEEEAAGGGEKERETSPHPTEEETATSTPNSSPKKSTSFGSPNPAEQTRQLSPEIPVPALVPSTAPDDTTASPISSESSPSKFTPQPVSSSTPQVIHPQPGSLMDLSKLKITKETQKTITEIFVNANKVTRPEKILIINFVAGMRANPCPHLGPVLTVRLSENIVPVTLPDGRQIDAIVEEYFHMNFNTGEWKRLRKQKPLTVTGQGAEFYGNAQTQSAPIPPVSTLTPTPSMNPILLPGTNPHNMGFPPMPHPGQGGLSRPF